MNLEEIKKLIKSKDKYPAHNKFVDAVLLQNHLPDLIAEVERLRRALTFYADKQNYDDSTKYRSDIAKDSGKKARQALEK